jgi:hypothetical protein
MRGMRVLFRTVGKRASRVPFATDERVCASMTLSAARAALAPMEAAATREAAG